MNTSTSIQVAATQRTRADVVAAIATRMADHEWAFQGEALAPSRWVAAEDNGDLDVWVHPESQRAIDEVLQSLGGVVVCSALDPARLCHLQWWLPTCGVDRDGAIVDVTIGDLRVGPVLMLPVEQVETVSSACSLPTGVVSIRRFVGSAAVVDLALRPLLRGRLVTSHRLTAARIAYAVADERRHEEIRTALRTALGTRGMITAQCWLFGDVAAEAQAPALSARPVVT